MQKLAVNDYYRRDYRFIRQNGVNLLNLNYNKLRSVKYSWHRGAFSGKTATYNHGAGLILIQTTSVFRKYSLVGSITPVDVITVGFPRRFYMLFNIVGLVKFLIWVYNNRVNKYRGAGE